MNTLDRPEPLIVVIIDGWGISHQAPGNAIWEADTPTMDMFARHYPAATLAAAGLEVGLPVGVPGNSEVGHRNIGAGRIEYQILATIDRSIAKGTFFDNQVLNSAIAHAKKNDSAVHLMGLVSQGGVHSQMSHLHALLELMVRNGWREKVYIHMFTDGRDTPPKSAETYVQFLEEAIGQHGTGTIASVTGRWYAMDRNKNWERTEATYNMLIGGERPPGASSASKAIERSYSQGVFDERIPPTTITRGGAPLASISDNDAVIFFNFRPDRARQLSQAFLQPDRVGFEAKRLENLYFVTLSEYDATLMAHTAFTEQVAEYPLARVISEAGLKQWHVAETEKYAHVTYYLNVGREDPFEGEDRLMIESSHARNFATEPAMRAEAITDAVLSEIERGLYDVYFINYANPDIVGHTGNLEATKKACAYVDASLARLYKVIDSTYAAMIITSDHGKAEAMWQPDSHDKKTSHTVSPVPFYYVRDQMKRSVAKSEAEVTGISMAAVGILADVAPTIIDILKLEKPSMMTGISLLGSLR